MSKSERVVKIGVVGCGAIGQRRHIPEVAANPKARLVALCDIVPSRAEEQAKKFGGEAYSDFESFLKHPDMDAVIIGTPNYLHAPMTLAALKAGRHVLVEKPMATTRKEAKAMIEAARKAGRFLMVGQNQRLMRPHIKAREILASGGLGKVLTFRTAFKHPGPEFWSVDNHPGTWFFQKEKAAMGVCGDLGIHKADLMRYLLGEEIVEVAAMIGTQNKRYPNGKLINVDDNALMLVKTQSGVMGSIIISWTNYGEPEANYTIIYCERGVMMLATDPTWGVIVRWRNGDEDRYKVGEIATNVKQVSSGVADMFIDGILAGKEPPINGMEGYRSLNVILTAFEACAASRTLKVGS